MPLNGRTPFSLATFAPGAVPGRNFRNNPLLLGIHGGWGRATEILIDGWSATVPRNRPGIYAATVMPSVDRVQDFKVHTNLFSAEFGRTAAGVMSVVIKSGSNELHGSACGSERNGRLDANSFLLNRAGRALDVFRCNQFGFTLGRPTIRNRTLYSGGYEGLRQRIQQTIAATVPIADQISRERSRRLRSARLPGLGRAGHAKAEQ